MLVPKKPSYKIKNFFQFKTLEPQDIWQKLLFFKSGCDALIFALQNLKIMPGSKIIIPAYICKSVPIKLKEYKYEPIFVDIKPDLSIDNDSILKLVNSDQISAIMLVDYFGYQQKENISLAEQLKKYNISILIDRCHSNIPSDGDLDSLNHIDAIIYSFKKTFFVKNGGALLTKGYESNIKRDIFLNDLFFFSLKICEMIIFKLGWPNIYSKLFDSIKRIKIFKRKAILSAPKISPLVLLPYSLYNQLADSKSLKNIVSKRIDNHVRMKNFALNNKIPFLFHHQEDKYAPQIFPIIDKNTNIVNFLNKNGIGAYSWPGEDLYNYVTKNKHLFPNTINANNQIICTPIHQDINTRQLKKLKETLLRFRS